MKRGKTMGDYILLALEKTIEGYINFEDFAYNTHKYLYGYPRKINQPLILQTLKRLREKGYLDLVDGEKLIFKLTDPARDYLVWRKIKFNKEIWDEKWRVVIFDIPEKQRKLRDLLRSKLKYWNFEPWQKSIWVTKINCTEELRKFIKDIGIEEWVMVLESENVGKISKPFRS